MIMNNPSHRKIEGEEFALFTIVSLVTLGLFFMSATPASAQTQPTLTEYKLLAPIPLTGGQPTTETTAAKFIPGLFRLTLMIATGLAVLVLIYGGIQYMSTDAFTGKENAKDTIWNAIMGLLLALSAWLIIATINPKLLEFNFEIPVQQIRTTTTGLTTPTGGGTGGTRVAGRTMTPQEVAADAQVRTRLQNAGITINAGPCIQGQTSGCTNLNSLGSRAIDGLISLRSNCGNCTVIVSGGTEGGHATHGAGLPIVDLRRTDQTTTLNSYITTNGQTANANPNCGIRSAPRYSLGGATYVNEGDHWHVCY